MRSRLLAIVVAVVVPLAALGFVITRGGGSHRTPAHTPARLPISAAAGGERATAAGAAQADTMLAPYGGIVYKAGPNLPALGRSARAYKIDRDGADEQLARVKAAFADGGKTSPDGFFDSYDRLAWTYSQKFADGGVVSSGTAVACPPDVECPVPETTIPQHPAGFPTQDEARKIALELLDLAGVDTAAAAVAIDDYVSVWSVRVDPIVDGVATEGFGASVAVGPNGVIEYANGMLGRPVAADEYPLIGTSAAIEKLNNGELYFGGGPRPLTAADTPAAAEAGGTVGAEPGTVGPTEPAPPVTDTIPPPPPPQEITLTGAEQVLTLATSYDGTESWLVPAYRFTTSDGPGPTVLAIDDSFLAPPPGEVPNNASSIEPGEPGTIEPQPASDLPASDPAVKEPSTGG